MGEGHSGRLLLQPYAKVTRQPPHDVLRLGALRRHNQVRDLGLLVRLEYMGRGIIGLNFGTVFCRSRKAGVWMFDRRVKKNSYALSVCARACVRGNELGCGECWKCQ